MRSVDKYGQNKPLQQHIKVTGNAAEIKKGDAIADLEVIENGTLIGTSKLISDTDSRASANVVGSMGWFGGSICLVLVAWQRGRRIARRTSPKSISSSRR
jgi:hypothetical protein